MRIEVPLATLLLFYLCICAYGWECRWCRGAWRSKAVAHENEQWWERRIRWGAVGDWGWCPEGKLWKASVTFSLPTGEERIIILPCILYNITGEVQQVRRHVNDVLQDAVFLTVPSCSSLSFLALTAGESFLAETLVGLHADPTVTTGGFAFGCKWQAKAEISWKNVERCLCNFEIKDRGKVLWLALYLVSRRGPPSQHCSSICQWVYSGRSCIRGSKRCLASLDPPPAVCTP